MDAGSARMENGPPAEGGREGTGLKNPRSTEETEAGLKNPPTTKPAGSRRYDKKLDLGVLMPAQLS